MGTDNYAISCLVGAMDHLWFHQVILRSKILQSSSMAASQEELPNDSSTKYFGTKEVISEENSSIISNQDEYSNEQDCDEEEETPRRLNLSGSKTVSHSSSPSSLKRRSYVYPSARRRLNKTMSCKSLCELELEEVKGFLDLGFIFDKEHLSKRMMSVIPGLQRLDLDRNTTDHDDDTRESTEEDLEEEEEDEGELQRRVTRPYLSEAWLIKRPDSPLLNIRIPTGSTADDMKQHLKYWAKTVASAIRLES